jgi:hypothetical protein
MTFDQSTCTATLEYYQNFNGSLRSKSPAINGVYTVTATGLGTVDFTASLGPKFAFGVTSPNTDSPPVETALRLLNITPDYSGSPTTVSLVLVGTCSGQ